MTNEKIYEAIEKVEKAMNENLISAEVDQFHNLPVISIHIEWGDWKHSHLFARHIMNELGFVFIRSKVTEEDGSDCYSATHYFAI